MRRSQLRQHVFTLLFMSEFRSPEEMTRQIELYLDGLEEPASDSDRAYISEKTGKIIEKIPEIDEMVDSSAEGWSTSRMGRVELSIIRLAVYEMKFDDDIPTGVAINEAVELAKKYGQDDAGSFVNGILARLV